MIQDNDGLVRVEDAIDQRFRHLFHHATFNHMQSAILSQALQTDCNMVVAAPTGSGKTVIHELAIIRLLSNPSTKPPKIVYIAPNTALCQQRMREWDNKFSPLGQSVLEVTGDIDFKQCLRLIAMATIIITTPEKWDSLTRTWKDHVFLLGAIDLLLVDEIHHLGEDRGATLEALIVRMRMLSRVYTQRTGRSSDESHASVNCSMRIIVLSATLPNLADIGEWLGCRHDAIHYFDETFRPVPLTVHTLSMGSMSNPFLFDRSLDERVGPLVMKYSDGRQVLVFCPSKKSTETLASLLTQRVQVPREIFQHIRRNSSLITAAHDQTLRALLFKGMGYHHSGLSPDDRALVEQLYLDGSIYVLCSTSTLAHGVNLPAHLVIIKGTSCWRGGSRGYERTSKADVIQMLGRAGRPGMDDQGVAVIMTSREDQDFYADVSLNAEVVESTLQTHLVEAICAEITQSVITSVAECVQWMQSTFFYIRMRKSPTKYGFPELHDADELQTLLESICSSALGDLTRAGLIQFDATSQRIAPNTEASVMTRNLIRFPTMERLVRIPAQCSIQELLQELSQSQELNKPVRRLEKSTLNDMMRTVRFPLKQRVQDPWVKSYVLLQAAIGRAEIKDFSLRVEQAEVVECGLRVLAAVRELAVHRELGRLLESAILLDRALRVRLWESNYGSVFHQCSALQPATANSLILRGVRTIGDVLGCSPGRVQDLAGCTQAEARSMLALANLLHTASREVQAQITKGNLKITIFNSNQGSATVNTTDTAYPAYQLVVYNAGTGKALCIRKLPAGVQETEFTVPVGADLPIERVQCSLLSSYVGIDAHQHAKLNATAPAPAVSSTGENVQPPQAQSASSRKAQTTSKAPSRESASRKGSGGTATVVDDSYSAPNSTSAARSCPPLTAYFPSQPSPAKALKQPTNPFGEGSGAGSGKTMKSWTDAFAYREDPPVSSSPSLTQRAEQRVMPPREAPELPERRLPGPEERGEIASIRRKAAELELDRIPVKRLRSAVPASAPGVAEMGANSRIPAEQSTACVVSPYGTRSHAWQEEPQRAVTGRATAAPPLPSYPSPEGWYRRVTPARRSFFDESDDPVIPSAFDFDFSADAPEPPLLPAQAVRNHPAPAALEAVKENLTPQLQDRPDVPRSLDKALAAPASAVKGQEELPRNAGEASDCVFDSIFF